MEFRMSKHTGQQTCSIPDSGDHMAMYKHVQKKKVLCILCCNQVLRNLKVKKVCSLVRGATPNP